MRVSGPNYIYESWEPILQVGHHMESCSTNRAGWFWFYGFSYQQRVEHRYPSLQGALVSVCQTAVEKFLGCNVDGNQKSGKLTHQLREVGSEFVPFLAKVLAPSKRWLFGISSMKSRDGHQPL